MWVESLTRRETAILARLAEGKSNREIAAIETLSLSMVKWYVNQIFGKLGATQRDEAVARAREFGLLSASSDPPVLKHNLPRPLSSFIGREQTIAQVVELVSNYALVTLTGTGGTGKTRLTLKVGEQFVAQARELFPDGVWLVQLAPLANPQLVPRVAASVLGLGEAAGLFAHRAAGRLPGKGAAAADSGQLRAPGGRGGRPGRRRAGLPVHTAPKAALAALRASLGEARYAALWAEGRTLGFEAAVELAMG